MEITIKDLWNVLRKSLILILVCAILCGAAAYMYTTKYMRKVYSSSVECVLIQADNQQGATDSGEVTRTPIEELNNFLIVGGRAIESLSRLLLAEDTMESLLKTVENLRQQNPNDPKYQLQNKYSATQLHNLFSFTDPEGDTNLVFTISCDAYSAHDTYVLLNAFGEVVNERAVAFWGDDTYQIELCTAPKLGYLKYPHVNRITAVAAVVGACVPYLIVLAFTLFNSRIKKEEDLKNNFEYPLLGRVPHF